MPKKTNDLHVALYIPGAAYTSDPRKQESTATPTRTLTAPPRPTITTEHLNRR
jgi:hypothetical protein